MSREQEKFKRIYSTNTNRYGGNKLTGQKREKKTQRDNEDYNMELHLTV